MRDFRRADELKCRLMPYVYAQARDCSERGLPMLRALFIEYPDDPGAWQVEDEYLFGSSILAAPLFETGATERNVYLPGGGKWIDYQTGKAYPGGWQHIEAGEIPIVMLVRDGTVLPHIALAQSMRDMDWTKLDLRVFAADAQEAHGLICLPEDQRLRKLVLVKEGEALVMKENPTLDKVVWTIRR